VAINKTVRLIIKVTNHVGLNLKRGTEVLAVSIRAASQTVNIIKDKLVKSIPIP
jgi:hypothetical protein